LNGFLLLMVLSAGGGGFSGLVRKKKMGDVPIAEHLPFSFRTDLK
jgi:hypothetical protein